MFDDLSRFFIGSPRREESDALSPRSRALDVTRFGRVVVVGRPWERRTEKDARRNNAVELGAWLEERAGAGRFLVLNLGGASSGVDGEEKVDYHRFQYQVVEADLERNPSLETLFGLCHSASHWLSMDEANVLALFCNNGCNGCRLFVSVFLAFNGSAKNVHKSLEMFYRERLRLDYEASSVLSKAHPSFRHLITKAQGVISMGRGALQLQPLRVYMLLLDHLPLTTATGIIEPKLFSLFGPSEEEVASAVQPVLRIYELGLNKRRLVYSSAQVAESTVHWNPKEGKLMLKVEIEILGDAEIECVFAENTMKHLFRYSFHTAFFKDTNGVFGVSGPETDTPFRNVIDDKFKLDLVVQPVAHSVDKLVQSSQLAELLSVTVNKDLALRTLTRAHFLNPDPSLCERLCRRGCDDLEAQFTLQVTNNSLAEAERVLGFHEHGAHVAFSSGTPQPLAVATPSTADRALKLDAPASPAYVGYHRSPLLNGLNKRLFRDSPAVHSPLRQQRSTVPNVDLTAAEMLEDEFQLILEDINAECERNPGVSENKADDGEVEAKGGSPEAAPQVMTSIPETGFSPGLAALLQDADRACNEADGNELLPENAGTPVRQPMRTIHSAFDFAEAADRPPLSTPKNGEREWSAPPPLPPRLSSTKKRPECEEPIPPSSSPTAAEPAAPRLPGMPAPVAPSCPSQAVGRFERMLRMGVPEGAVRSKMAAEGVDPGLVFKETSGQGAAERPAVPLARVPQNPVTLPEEYFRFEKMLKMGVPAGAVEAKLRAESLDPAVLFGAVKASKDQSVARSGVLVETQRRRKRIHMDGIPDDRIKSGSIWNSSSSILGLDDVQSGTCAASEGELGGFLSPSKLSEDMRELEALFLNSPGTKSKTAQGQGVASRELTQRKRTSAVPALLDAKRVQNVSIGLRKLKLDDDSICRALNEFDDSVLDSEKVEVMFHAQLLPSVEEQKKLLAYRGDTSFLNAAERFLRNVAACVPHAETRLNAMFFRAEFDRRAQTVLNDLDLAARAAQELLSSTLLAKLFQVVLLVTNKMNNGAEGGAMRGFTVGSLLKLSQTKSAVDRQLSILDFIANFVNKRIPEMTGLRTQLAHLDEAKRLQLGAIESEVSSLHLGYQCVQRAVKLTSKENPGDLIESDTSEVGRLQQFSSHVQESLRQVESRSAIAKSTYFRALEYFCEDPSIEMHEFFGTLDAFLLAFVRACAAAEQRKLRAEEQAKKQTRPTACSQSKATFSNEEENQSRSSNTLERTLSPQTPKQQPITGTVLDTPAEILSPRTLADRRKMTIGSSGATPNLRRFLKNVSGAL